MSPPEVFTFPVSENVALSLDGRDTRQVLANGAFADVEFAHIIESFAGVLGNPLSMTITKRQYDFAMRELLPRVMQWSPEDQKKMSYFLSRLFYAYEQAGQDSVATDELLVGLSLLVKGSKTYKLQSFWSHFATGSSSDGEETVQQAELARLLSALLTGLFSVCKISNNYDENMIGHAVHRRAVRTALDVFRELGVEDSEPITFDMFGAWYNEFGFEVVQWLELLDLQKWPLSSMMEEVSQEIDTYTGDGEMLAYNDVRGDEGEEDDDPVQLSFDFPECSAGRISFKESDVERLAQVISLTELHLKSPKSVAQVFFDASEEMILDRAQFDECVQYVMPLEELADQARLDEKEILIIAEQLVNRFSVFFSAFERHPGSGVNKEELAAGFSLLCQGNKSEKLNHAWNIIASGSEEGRLTRRGLWRFLRSFLQMLLAASGEVASSPSDISTTADQGAVTTAALVFADADRAYEHSVSFDEFAQWYTHGGFRAASWFELLDLKKWVIESPEEPALEYSGMRSSSAKVQTADSDEDSDGVDAAIEAADSLNQVDEVSADYDEYDEYEYDDDDDDTDEINDGAVVEGTSPICFTFSLTTVGHCLNIVQADVDFVMHIVTSSHFDELTPERAASVLMWYMDGNEGGQAFYSRGDESSLAKISYNKAMRDMLPRVAECGQETVKFLTYALSNIFYFFVPEGQNQAPVAEVATALSLFCQGSKSAKLQQGFTNFAWPAESESEEERMDGIQLRRFLSSILSVLFTCCRHTGVLQLNEAREIVAFAVEELAVRIMSRARRMLSVHDDTMVITFEDFGAWYNEEGCDDAPWLELLDLRKWQPSPAADDNKYDKPEDLDEHEMMEGLDATRFSFALLDAQGEPSSFILRISESDISSIRNLVTKTQLCTKSLSSVCRPLLDAAEKGLLDKRSFDRCMSEVALNNSMSKDEKKTFSVLLSSIFYNFEVGDEDENANALELAIGMLLLCKGDKSSKLNYAWQVIDMDNDDGYLNRAELLFFLRAFIRMLVALSYEASTKLTVQETKRYATDMASWLSSTVMAKYSELDGTDGLVSFDSFANWWLDGGSEVAPWLELLDLSKWVLPLE